MPLFKTFLYAARDRPSLRIKFGFVTSPSLVEARRQVLSRYRTCYFHCEVLQVVPVPVLGRAAEADLLTRLTDNHIGREFLEFRDEATLLTTLDATYRSLACPEAEAHQVESRRGAEGAHRKRLREEAELQAATQAALLVKKMKLERQETRRQEKMQAAAEAKAKAQAKAAMVTVQEQDILRTWVLESLQLGGEEDFVTKKDIEVAARNANVPVSQKRLRRKLEDTFGKEGAHYKLQHYACGHRYSSAWLRLKWV